MLNFIPMSDREKNQLILELKVCPQPRIHRLPQDTTIRIVIGAIGMQEADYPARPAKRQPSGRKHL